MVGRELLGDAAAGGGADDVDRPAEGAADRVGVLGRHLGHRHPAREPAAAVDVVDAAAGGERPQGGELGAPRRAVGDARVRREAGEVDQRRAGSDGQEREAPEDAGLLFRHRSTLPAAAPRAAPPGAESHPPGHAPLSVACVD